MSMQFAKLQLLVRILRICSPVYTYRRPAGGNANKRDYPYSLDILKLHTG
jgi:hypothetical protein